MSLKEVFKPLNRREGIRRLQWLLPWFPLTPFEEDGFGPDTPHKATSHKAIKPYCGFETDCEFGCIMQVASGWYQDARPRALGKALGLTAEEAGMVAKYFDSGQRDKLTEYVYGLEV